MSDRISESKLQEAVSSGRAVRVLSIDDVDRVVHELIDLRAEIKATDAAHRSAIQDADYFADQAALLRVELDLARGHLTESTKVVLAWGVSAGADPVALQGDLACAGFGYAADRVRELNLASVPA